MLTYWVFTDNVAYENCLRETFKLYGIRYERKTITGDPDSKHDKKFAEHNEKVYNDLLQINGQEWVNTFERARQKCDSLLVPFTRSGPANIKKDSLLATFRQLLAGKWKHGTSLIYKDGKIIDSLTYPKSLLELKQDSTFNTLGYSSEPHDYSKVRTGKWHIELLYKKGSFEPLYRLVLDWKISDRPFEGPGYMFPEIINAVTFYNVLSPISKKDTTTFIDVYTKIK